MTDKDCLALLECITPHIERARAELLKASYPNYWNTVASREVRLAADFLCPHLSQSYATKEIRAFVQVLCRIDEASRIGALKRKIQKAQQRQQTLYIFPLFGVSLSVPQRLGDARVVPYGHLNNWIAPRRRENAQKQYRDTLRRQFDEKQPSTFLIIPFDKTSSWIDENWAVTVGFFEELLYFFSADGCYTHRAEISLGTEQGRPLRWYMAEDSQNSTSASVRFGEVREDLPLNQLSLTHKDWMRVCSVLLSRMQKENTLRPIESNLVRAIQWFAWGVRHELPSSQLLGYVFACEACVKEAPHVICGKKSQKNKNDKNREQIAEAASLVLSGRLKTSPKNFKKFFEQNYVVRSDLAHGTSSLSEGMDDAREMRRVAHVLITETLLSSTKYDDVSTWLEELGRKRIVKYSLS